MKEITWDESLSVQIAEIDEDHRKLVKLFNMISQSLDKHEPGEYIHALLKELITCTAWHFSHEERLMLRHNYQGLEAHKQEHLELLENAQQLLEDFQKDTRLSDASIEQLEHWLTGHILGSDMEMAEFLSDVIE